MQMVNENMRLRFLLAFAIFYDQITILGTKELLLDNSPFALRRPVIHRSRSLLNQQLEQLRATLNITRPASSSVVAEIARCLRCTKSAFLAVRAALVSGNNFERFVNICDRVRGMLQCTRAIPGKCMRTSGLETLMGSFQYLCEDQFAAYRHVMECLDIHSTEVSRACEKTCHANRFMLGWFFYGFMRSTWLLSIPETEVPAKVNVLYFRKITSETCLILTCYFTCLRERYNTKCGGIGGSMLMEALLRPLLSLHRSWAFNPIGNTMRLVLPSQCDVIATEGGLNFHRLGKDIDRIIKHMFPQDVTYEYSDLLEDRNLSSSIPEIILKSGSSPLDQKEFLSIPIKTSSFSNMPGEAPSIHTEDVENAIEEFRGADRLQRMQPN